jgi:hypothetical protein
MNRIRRLCRWPARLLGRASVLLAFAAAPAVWRPDPPFPPGWKLPPGWHKHPPLPLGHVAGPAYKVPARIRAHAIVTGGMPGWQIILLAAGGALLAAALAVAVHRLRGRALAPSPAGTARVPVPSARPDQSSGAEARPRP